MADPVTIFTLSIFFAEMQFRLKKGLNSYESNKVMSVNMHPGGIIRGKVHASQKKRVYDVEVSDFAIHFACSLIREMNKTSE